MLVRVKQRAKIINKIVMYYYCCDENSQFFANFLFPWTQLYDCPAVWAYIIMLLPFALLFMISCRPITSLVTIFDVVWLGLCTVLIRSRMVLALNLYFRAVFTCFPNHGFVWLWLAAAGENRKGSWTNSTLLLIRRPITKNEASCCLLVQ